MIYSNYSELGGKHIVLGVTGGIAAYKAAQTASNLVKAGADVDVIMTENACEFITPATFRAITKNPVTVNTFSEPKIYEINHIALAHKADAFLIVPATANFIGKVAGGIADDMLSTTVMATKAPVVIAPAMNSAMYENPIVQANIEKLKQFGYIFAEPEEGRLACGDTGKGRLCGEDTIAEILCDVLTKKDLTNKNVLITAGPTREYMDPVRYITNPSSGKMGYALARNAKRRGAKVTLVSGPVNIEPPNGIETVNVTTALQMYEEVMKRCETADIIVKSAAVGDFRPKSFSEHKLKKDAVGIIELEKNPDILAEVCKKAAKAVVVGFCMETRDLKQQAYEKLLKKGADFIVANNIAEKNAGFAGDNNTVCIINKDGKSEDLGNMSKLKLAGIILDKALEMYE